MSTLEMAIRIAVTAHAGQTEKGGAAYITHPLRLMAAVDGEEAKIVAVLHDVIEDTPVTIEDLRREGFSEDLLAGVACVTHSKDETYADYVVRCKGHPVARRVKLADLVDNTRLDRCILRVDRAARDLALMARRQFRKVHERTGANPAATSSTYKSTNGLSARRRGAGTHCESSVLKNWRH